MVPDSCEQVEIDNFCYQCGKMKRTVLITYLATTSDPGDPGHCVPEMTAFDCSHRHVCGVCTAKGRVTSCRWERCVHPGLCTQEASTE